MENIVIASFIFIIAASIGSFLNVVIERTREKKSFWGGRSFCPRCNHVLAWYDLIPVFSLLFLRAKCRYCKAKISWQYFFVELATAGVFLLNWWIFIPMGWLTVGFWWIMSMFLIIIFIYDLKYQYIYDRFSIPAIVLAFAWQFWQSGLGWKSIIGGFLVGAGVYLALYVMSKGKDIGGGDIRLGALLGVLVGFEKVIYLFLFTYGVAVLYLIFYFIIKRKKIKYLPLGPFLIIGFLIILWGGDIPIDWVEKGFAKIVDFLI